MQDQLDSLPYLCRFQYSETAEYLTSLTDPLIAAYQSFGTSAAGGWVVVVGCVGGVGGGGGGGGFRCRGGGGAECLSLLTDPRIFKPPAPL